ncbi:MAG: hypothetical protein ACK5HP_03565 [Bacilli bacterium]
MEKPLEEYIFVLCKTDMSKSITKRTLSGYNDYSTNIINIPTLKEDLKKMMIKLFQRY